MLASQHFALVEAPGSMHPPLRSGARSPAEREKPRKAGTVALK